MNKGFHRYPRFHSVPILPSSLYPTGGQSAHAELTHGNGTHPLRESTGFTGFDRSNKGAKFLVEPIHIDHGRVIVLHLQMPELESGSLTIPKTGVNGMSPAYDVIKIDSSFGHGTPVSPSPAGDSPSHNNLDTEMV